MSQGPKNYWRRLVRVSPVTNIGCHGPSNAFIRGCGSLSFGEEQGECDTPAVPKPSQQTHVVDLQKANAAWFECSVGSYAAGKFSCDWEKCHSRKEPAFGYICVGVDGSTFVVHVPVALRDQTMFKQHSGGSIAGPHVNFCRT